SYTEISEALQDNAEKEITVGFFRNDTLMQLPITLGSDAKLGVMLKSPLEVFVVKHIDYNVFQAIPAGIKYGCQTLVTYVSSLKILFTKGGASNLGGFGTIASVFPKEWDWYQFWTMTAFLAIILAFMNIIPIPGLDGGHIVFTLWEMITRRKPSEKFLERAQMVGMILLFALLIFANGNDLWRWLRGKF
ncbi:MAG: site-2 protease family protein, partial [Bacteroidales bacterium]|nr:site-2 protease family protein [Bacteroidales bacterium]